MDRSTRNLSIITLLVLVIFLALNNIARRSALIDWSAVVFFLLLALGIWFYDRISRRGVDDSEASDATVIEPLVYDHPGALIGIPDTIELVAPNPGTVIKPEHPHAPVIDAAPPPAPTPIVEEKVAPPPPAPAPVIPPAPVVSAAVAQPEPAAAPVVEETPPEAEGTKPVKSASRGKGKAAVSAAAPSAPVKADDLKVVEGIGPKMEKALNAAGITTFAQLAASTEEQINAAIVAAGMRFAPSVPTWAQQASYAAKGDLVGLEAFQKTLAGGRKSK